MSRRPLVQGITTPSQPQHPALASASLLAAHTNGHQHGSVAPLTHSNLAAQSNMAHFPSGSSDQPARAYQPSNYTNAVGGVPREFIPSEAPRTLDYPLRASELDDLAAGMRESAASFAMPEPPLLAAMPQPARPPSPAHSVVSDVSDLHASQQQGDPARKGRAVRIVSSRFLQAATEKAKKPAEAPRVPGATVKTALRQQPAPGPATTMSSAPQTMGSSTTTAAAGARPRASLARATAAAILDPRQQPPAQPASGPPGHAHAAPSAQLAEDPALSVFAGAAAALDEHTHRPSVPALAQSGAANGHTHTNSLSASTSAAHASARHSLAGPSASSSQLAASTASQTSAGVALHQQIELLEHRLLQWTYICAQSDFAAAQQEQNAVKQLNAVWALVEEKRRVLALLHKRLAAARQARLVEDYLQAMGPSLRQAAPVLDALEQLHARLALVIAESVDRVRVVGIADIDAELLERCLEHGAAALAAVAESTSTHAHRARASRTQLEALVGTMSSEADQLSAADSALRAVASRATLERSLAAQSVQLHDLQRRQHRA